MRSVRLSLPVILMGFLTFTAFSQNTAPWEYRWTTPIPITDFGTATSSLTITDNYTITDMIVMVNIDHSKASDLRITLKDPSGLAYVLSEYNGSYDQNNGFPYEDYRYTVFDNTPGSAYGVGLPGTNISDPSNKSPLFRGIYVPENPLPTGISTQGTWTLEVYDNLVGNTGTLVSWGITFNRYDYYKDIRLGATIDLFGGDRYPTPFIDDFTTVPPYTVHGYRPESNTIYGYYLYQNSKTSSATAFQFDYTPPMANKVMSPTLEGTVGVGVYYVSGVVDNIHTAGKWDANMQITQRTDLYMTRPDNSRNDQVVVTPGSLAFDNGVASSVWDIAAFQDECDGATYTISESQTISSVDIWQSDAVELEPTPTPGYATIRVYDNNFTLLYTFGPYDLPPQGNKWVSYPVTPTVLPAGTYTIAICVENVPTTGSTGYGVDLLGSPFAEGGSVQRYYGNGLQWYSFDLGGSWDEEYSSAYGTKMIRPNFVYNNSDIGVIAFDSPAGNVISGSFTPTVRFGSFAHNPYLPNLLTVGTFSVIDNSTNQIIRQSEKRIFFGPASYETSVSFDMVSGLPSGSYTLRAEVWRSDDENDINNVYERQYTVSAAPIIVSFNSKISANKVEEITAKLTEQGYDVQTHDRTFESFSFPQNGNVVWAGDITPNEAAKIREFVSTGNFFGVVPTEKVETDFRTQVFSDVATSQELGTMENTLTAFSKVTPPAVDLSIAKHMLQDANITTFTKDVVETRVDYKLRDYVSSYMSRMESSNDFVSPPTYRQANLNYRASANIEVQGTRLGNLSLAQIVPNQVIESQQSMPVAVDENSFDIAQNYPNPFNPTTSINYNILNEARVSIRVYDLLGRTVATLVNTVQDAGLHTIVWDATTDAGTQVSSGIYLYRMEATPLDGSAPSILTKKMILSR